MFFFFSLSFFDARKWYIYERLEQGERANIFLSWMGNANEEDIFGFGYFSVLSSSLLLVESFARDLRNPRSQIFLFLKSLFLPSVSFVSPRRRMNYAHTHTHTHTRDIKKISLPDVDDFLICCKIITLNSIAKVLLGSHFFFFLFKILLTKTEKLG